MSPSNEDGGGGGDNEDWKASYDREEDSFEV